MYSSPFAVAGMPLTTSTSSSHAQPHSTSTPNLHSWGTSSLNASGGQGASVGSLGGNALGGSSPGMATSFSDSHGLSQSRSHYQSGYLMSSQHTNSPPGGQHPHTRTDEPPIVQTKAKMNQIFSRGSTADFGMDSMFESSRKQRQRLADEDAPPRSSVFDIPNEVPFDKAASSHLLQRSALLDTTLRRPLSAPQSSPSHHRQGSTQQNGQPIYLVVFGYPIDKYSLAVEYFQSLGTSVTQPEMCDDIQNCFKIGYYDPAEAMRAARKNGEVLAGSWMIGVKYADPNDALFTSVAPSSVPSSTTLSSSPPTMDMDSPPRQQVQTPAFGTPIRLAPSSAAFRRNVPGAPRPGNAQDHEQHQQVSPQGPQGGWGTLGPGVGAGTPRHADAKKGSVLGQVSDLIFGW